MLYACTVRFDVTENLENFLVLFGTKQVRSFLNYFVMIYSIASEFWYYMFVLYMVMYENSLLFLISTGVVHISIMIYIQNMFLQMPCGQLYCNKLNHNCYQPATQLVGTWSDRSPETLVLPVLLLLYCLRKHTWAIKSEWKKGTLCRTADWQCYI
jgi:hypothetical protein